MERVDRTIGLRKPVLLDPSECDLPWIQADLSAGQILVNGDVYQYGRISLEVFKQLTLNVNHPVPASELNRIASLAGSRIKRSPISSVMRSLRRIETSLGGRPFIVQSGVPNRVFYSMQARVELIGADAQQDELTTTRTLPTHEISLPDGNVLKTRGEKLAACLRRLALTTKGSPVGQDEMGLVLSDRPYRENINAVLSRLKDADKLLKSFQWHRVRIQQGGRVAWYIERIRKMMLPDGQEMDSLAYREARLLGALLSVKANSGEKAVSSSELFQSVFDKPKPESHNLNLLGGPMLRLKRKLLSFGWTVSTASKPNRGIEQAYYLDRTDEAKAALVRSEEFANIYREYRDVLLIHASRKLRNNLEDAEDIVNQASLNAWVAWPRFRPIKGLPIAESHKAFFFKIINHLIIDKYRKDGTHQQVKLEVQTFRETRQGYNPSRPFDPTARDPAEIAEINFDVEGVKEALSCLSENQRRAVVLRHVDGMGYPGIAQVMNKREGAVRELVHSGLKKLRSNPPKP